MAVMPSSKAMISAVLREYIGIPYCLGGRSMKGVDCYGLVYLVLREVFNLDPPEYLTLKIQENGLQRAKAFRKGLAAGRWEKCSQGPETGQVILLRSERLPIHCGIVVSTELMLHCEHGVNSCIERIESVRWAKRIEGFYRLLP